MALDDFGEKIGGARKDLRGNFHKDDIARLTPIERHKLVRKDMVWPQPDYLKLVQDDGYEQKAVATIKALRDAFPSAPVVRKNCQTEDYQKACNLYIVGINAIKDAVRGCRTQSEISEKLKTDPEVQEYFGRLEPKKSYLRGPTMGFQRSPMFERWSGGEMAMSFPSLFAIEVAVLDAMTQKLSRKSELLIRRNPDWPAGASRVEAMIRKEGASIEPSPRADGWILAYQGIPVREQDFSFFRRYRKSGALCGMIFKTKSEGEDFLRNTVAHALTGERQSRTKKLQGILSGGTAKGDPTSSYRVGPVNLTRPAEGEDYLRSFHMRGGEFGVWINQKQRQEILNRGYDGFCDLADALDLDKSQIGLGGNLAIAFGARGLGGTMAASAHYEPGRQVINLTKPRGEGSLAHEYGHALDHYLGDRASEIGLNIPKLDGVPLLSGATLSRLGLFALPEKHQAEAEKLIALNHAMQSIWLQSEDDSRRAVKQRALENRDASLAGFPDRIELMVRRCEEAIRAGFSEEADIRERSARCAEILARAHSLEYAINHEKEVPLTWAALQTQLPLPDRTKKDVHPVELGIDDDLMRICSVVKTWNEKYIHADEPGTNREESGYHATCRIIDKTMGFKKPYFARTEEMFARAFEACVETWSEKNGRLNPFLSQPTNSAAFPAGKEREDIMKTLLPALQEVVRDIPRPERPQVEDAEPALAPVSDPPPSAGQNSIQELMDLFSDLPEKRAMGPSR